MALPFHTTVKTASFFDEDSSFTMNLPVGVTVADVGKAMSADAGTNSAKLAVADEIIIGRLETFEARAAGNVGAVSTKGQLSFLTTGTFAIGVGMVGGATAGYVKPAPVVTPTTAVAVTAAQLAAIVGAARSRCVEFDNTAHTAVVNFG